MDLGKENIDLKWVNWRLIAILAKIFINEEFKNE